MFGSGDDTEFMTPAAPGNWCRFSSNRAELSRSLSQPAARALVITDVKAKPLSRLCSRPPVLGTPRLTLTTSRM